MTNTKEDGSNLVSHIAQPSPVESPQENILDQFVRDLEASGVVGEKRAAKLLYLAITTRVLDDDRPVCVAVKGPSSGGKSHLVNKVLAFFPKEAFQILTAMSPRALVYSTRDLRHKMLVIQEAAGLNGPIAVYIVRSLISEGRIDYMTTERSTLTGQFEARRITREGPTGLILTTTKIKIDAEVETRMLSISIDDTPEQTRAVLDKIGEGRADANAGVDFNRWHDLQSEIGSLDRHVAIAYAPTLTALVPPVALRLKRDISQLMALIKAHALLNHRNRPSTPDGGIDATLEDYAAVHDLVNDLFSQGVAATVKPTTRETVATVARLLAEKEGGLDVSVTGSEVKTALALDKSAVSRRIADAIEQGYLINDEENEKRPAKLRLGDSMPEDRKVLPSPDELHEALRHAAGIVRDEAA